MMENSYKKRMQRKKEHIDSRIEEANIDKGIVVLLTGNGKGKSSSAMGMICRALGYEMKVALVRFLKGEQQTGEDLFLDSNSNVVSAHMESGFTWNTQDQELDKKLANETWLEAEKFLADPEINLVVLDEITYMINYKYLDEVSILKALSNRPEGQHVVITGRAATEGIIEASDTVSEVKDVKHAFRANIRAQKGIDL
ncbi:cob(I)yrinic acid a,c-diamide adenosyltransferase [Candidatus Thioglobus sp.]|nr:cob(I)yrinic acid a,c-diamide adenosyltransferase [Candidatus Thioglobus sp.]MDA8981382.1 cob(I)yrinic acid a,c-diamide adenosyltransferase [Candidatus Thioglobus sp.]